MSWLGAEVCGPGFRLEKVTSYFSNFLIVEEAAAPTIAQSPGDFLSSAYSQFSHLHDSRTLCMSSETPFYLDQLEWTLSSATKLNPE